MVKLEWNAMQSRTSGGKIQVKFNGRDLWLLKLVKCILNYEKFKG